MTAPYTEIDNLAIRRDVVNANDPHDIAEQIDQVYSAARAVGSLVTAGDTDRSTEWDDAGHGEEEPAGWWGQFWRTRENDGHA